MSGKWELINTVKIDKKIWVAEGFYITNKKNEFNHNVRNDGRGFRGFDNVWIPFGKYQ